MRLRGLHIFAFINVGLALGPPCAYAAKTDVVVLLNGDRITGEVKELMLGRLVYKTDDLGTTYIEWDKIASVRASGEFEVELESGEVLFGKIGPGPAAAEMTITLEAGDVVHPLAEILRITSIKRTFWGRVDGKLDLGASFNQASEIAQFTLHTEALIKRPNFWMGYDLDSIFTQQKQAEDTALHRFGLNYYYLFASRWLSISRIIFEQNRELGFDLRASVNLGAGRFVVQTNRTVLMLGLGAQVNRERPNEGDSTTNLAGLIVLRYWSFFFDYPHTDVDARLAVLPDLSSSGRLRIEADLTLRRELLKDFYLSITALNSFDSEPPTVDANKNDLRATLSLGWKF
jgi:hypothetical protein